MGYRKDAYLAVGIISIVFGAGCLLFSDTIWQVDFNGAENCTSNPVIGAQAIQSCGSVASMIGVFAGVGGFLLGLGLFFLSLARTTRTS